VLGFPFLKRSKTNFFHNQNLLGEVSIVERVEFDFKDFAADFMNFSNRLAGASRFGLIVRCDKPTGFELEPGTIKVWAAESSIRTKCEKTHRAARDPLRYARLRAVRHIAGMRPGDR
jgi:hypothetical protein